MVDIFADTAGWGHLVDPSQTYHARAADEQAWQLLTQRQDKEWSLVDCASFVVMRQRALLEALTTDREGWSGPYLLVSVLPNPGFHPVHPDCKLVFIGSCAQRTLLELAELRELILAAQERVARAVNTGLVLLYWQIGSKIRNEILQRRRAEYEEEILSTVSKELIREFGQGYLVPNLSRMIRFAEVFPNTEIVSAVSKELGWSHFVEILPLEDNLLAEYLTELPPREVLKKRLHEAIHLARKRLGNTVLPEDADTAQATPSKRSPSPKSHRRTR